MAMRDSLRRSEEVPPDEDRTYCDEISQRMLEYERDPRHFLKSMRARLALRRGRSEWSYEI